MHTIISLLRGINVGGNKKIKMADLRDLYKSLGYANIKTLLQTGNVVFQSETDDLEQIQSTIEEGIQAHYGFDVDILMLTPEDFKTIVEAHPFTDAQAEDPRKLVFVFLNAQPDASAVDALRDNHTGREIIDMGEHALYIYYTDGQGRSKLDHSRIERPLNVKATARNWNTTMKIRALLDEF